MNKFATMECLTSFVRDIHEFDCSLSKDDLLDYLMTQIVSTKDYMMKEHSFWIDSRNSKDVYVTIKQQDGWFYFSGDGVHAAFDEDQVDFMRVIRKFKGRND